MPIGRYENPAIRGLRRKRCAGIEGAWPIDREIAWIAERQGGHVHREQLRDIGLTTSAIDRRLESGRLHRRGSRTYAVGHPREDLEARLHAILLACGDGAALSHRVGAGRLGLLTFCSGRIDITGVVPTDGEERFLAIVRRGGFPPPAHHYGIALGDTWLEVDFAWPNLRIAVECDSSFHEVPIALETDHERDQDLLAAGWHVFRVTWRQLRYDPDRVLRRFRAFFERVTTAAPPAPSSPARAGS